MEEVLPKEAKIIPLVKVNQKQKTQIDKVAEEVDQEKNKQTETAKAKTDTATRLTTANKNQINERTVRASNSTRRQTHKTTRKCIERAQ